MWHTDGVSGEGRTDDHKLQFLSRDFLLLKCTYYAQCFPNKIYIYSVCKIFQIQVIFLMYFHYTRCVLVVWASYSCCFFKVDKQVGMIETQSYLRHLYKYIPFLEGKYSFPMRKAYLYGLI